MGAWGTGAFENDDAGDWVWELEDDEDGGILVTALREIADADVGTYLEAPDCSVAIAAAEVVASARGVRSQSLPTEATVWLDAHANLVSDDLVALAAVAISRVATESELQELWHEDATTADMDSWHERIASLLARLR